MQIFKDYVNGELIRFVEHNGKLYVDSDDIVRLVGRPPTIN